MASTALSGATPMAEPSLSHSEVPAWQLPQQPHLQALLGGARRPERLHSARHLPRKHAALAPLVLPVRLPQVLRCGLQVAAVVLLHRQVVSPVVTHYPFCPLTVQQPAVDSLSSSA